MPDELKTPANDYFRGSPAFDAIMSREHLPWHDSAPEPYLL
jgi:hypothetical protein